MERDSIYEFGNHLLALRTRIALTQSALAKQLGVHRRSVQNWETGVSYPKAEALQRLVTIFLRYHAWTSGDEREAARAFWTQAAENSFRALPAFDDAWFAGVLALHTASSTDAGATTSEPAEARALIDWGEAISVSLFVGRDQELRTLHEWIVAEHCRVAAVVGIGGMGKSSLAISFAQRYASRFDVVLFRSLQNATPLALLLDQIIAVLADQPLELPEAVADKIALVVRLFRERRCLLILDNLEAIMQPGAYTGTYRAGYADYGALLHALGERDHQSCLVLTTREKPAELGPLEGRQGPVRTLFLGGLDEAACATILQTKDIVGTPDDVHELTRLYGGNPLALMLVREPIRELFGGNVGAFLDAGDAFFNGVGSLMAQQCARSTELERAIVFWLAIGRELTPLNTVLSYFRDSVPHGEVLAALESLRRRAQIESVPDRPAFTLQPVILEFVTEQVVEAVHREIVEQQPRRLHSHALVQATATDDVRINQERLLALPLLERLGMSLGGVDAVEQRLLALLAGWRDRPPTQQGYGPGNVLNLLRLLRGHLRDLSLTHLALRQAYLQDVDMQDTNLAGACIEDSVFTGTFDAVSSVAVSQGDMWAIGSRRGEVLLWTAGGRTLQRNWQAHTDMVRALAFSPDGRTLATSGSWDGTIKLWETTSGSLLWIGRHPNYTNSVAFAPHGRLLASSGNDGYVRLWDAQRGMQVQALAHPEPTSAVAWHPRGDVLATGDATGDVRLWRVASDEAAHCIHTMTGHMAHVERVAFAPDGTMLASASWDGTVRLWDVASGQERHRLTGHTRRVESVAWSADSRTLASAGHDHTIWLWDCVGEEYRVALQAHTGEVNGLAFTPDGTHLLSSSEDGTLRIWDVASARCVRVVQGYAASLCDVDWSPDGLAVVGGGNDGTVTIFPLAGDMTPKVLRGHTGVVIGVGWRPDDACVASSEWNNAVRLWNARTGMCEEVLRHPDNAGNFFDGLAWSPNGHMLASGTYHHGVLVWDRTTQGMWWAEPTFPTWIRHVAWSADGRYIAGGGADGTVYVWDAATRMLAHRLKGHHSTITQIAWRPGGAVLASGSKGEAGGELFVWDVLSEQRLAAIVSDAPTVSALTWGAHPDVVICGGDDGMLRWWDVRQGLCTLERVAHRGMVQSLRRSPHGDRVASCGNDGAIMLWDTERGVHLRTLRRDRPYERMNITGVTGVSEAQRASLVTLGAVEIAEGAPPATRTSFVDANRSWAARTPTDDTTEPIGRLPVQTTSFVGRSAEMLEVGRMIRDPACRLLTLVGPGGIGKTRLAMEVTAAHRDAFPDGIVVVALASVGDPSQIIAAIGDALALPVAGEPVSTARVMSFLRDRRMLLVLDNFEHLLGGADLLHDILAYAPRLTLLATSRERLHLQAEWLFDVEGLAYPTEDDHTFAPPPSVTALHEYSAVQLFVQRATQVVPRLPLSEATVMTIGHICRQVAGMPLALELAAASTRILPLPEIERQLKANLLVLATTFRDVPPRHQSLRAAIGQSWTMLRNDERTLLNRLAVFRSGCTLEAAARVTGATLPLLTSLADKSLLRHEHAEQGMATDLGVAEPRFTMLEPLRDYALEQFDASPDAEATRHHHAQYFTEFAEAAAAAWDTPAINAAVARQRRELDNMRAALQWACDTGASLLGLRLATALWGFWRSYGYSGEGRMWLAQLLRLEEQNDDPSTLAARRRGLHAAAWLASDQNDYATATRLFEEARALRDAVDEEDDETDVLINAARQARAAGQYGRATTLLEDALSRHRHLNMATPTHPINADPAHAKLGQVLRELALVLRERGEGARAVALLEEALALHRAARDRVSEALALLGLSDVARDRGDAAEVQTYSTPALAIFRESDMHWAIGFVLNNLALAAYYDGDLPQAETLARESEAVFRGLKADASLAEVLLTVGKILHARGEIAAAYEATHEALHGAHAVGPRMLLAIALEGLGLLSMRSGQAVRAVRLLSMASRLRKEMGTPAWATDQVAIDQTLMAAQSTLGADAFAAAWQEVEAVPIDSILHT